MTIQTKFNIGDSVWFTKDGIIINSKIVNFQIFVFNDHDIQIRYNIIGCIEALNEKFCYTTKQELLTQLH